MQVNQLKELCADQLKFFLTVDNLAETAVLADKINHEGLHKACVTFALQDANRYADRA